MIDQNRKKSNKRMNKTTKIMIYQSTANEFHVQVAHNMGATNFLSCFDTNNRNVNLILKTNTF